MAAMPRELVWVENADFRGWGCVCGWGSEVPVTVPRAESLSFEIVRSFDHHECLERRSEESVQFKIR
jgi:hypothetical protein